MTVAPRRLSPRRLAAWALFVTALVAGIVVVQHDSKWRGGAGEHDNSPPMRLMSRAQSARCLTAQGLQVTSAGARSLHVTGASHVDVTLTFYPTFDRAQAAAMETWSRSGRDAPRVTRDGSMAGAMDSVAYHAHYRLNNEMLSHLFSGCVGHQPVPPSA